MSQESLFKFPCKFAIKVFGLNSSQLVDEIAVIARNHCPEFNVQNDIIIKPSSKGNYLCLTVDVLVSSKTHLDHIYIDINAHPLVKMTL